MSDTVAAPHISAVVLDMDGLLIDTEPAWRAAETAVFAELGLRLSEDEMLSTMGRRPVEMVAHWRRMRPWPGAETGEPSDAAIADRVIDRMVAHVRARGEPMEGVDRAVALLRGLGLAWPLMRELRETEYQFRDAFVMDSATAEGTFGLKPTPWEKVVAATV